MSTALNARATRRRGATGDKTRLLLEVLQQPGRLSDVSGQLGWSTEETHALIKHAHEQGRVTRLSRGLYQISEAGQQALVQQAQRHPGVTFLRNSAPQPPVGEGWTPARKAWLLKFFSRLGARQCAELLNMKLANVRGVAYRQGLKEGEVSGYTLLSDLAEMTGQGYSNLYSCAQRAGVLTFPSSAKGEGVQRRHAALVPDSWAEALVSEMQPPTPDDVAVAALRQELGLSKTQANRKVQGKSYLRTPVQGGQAKLHVSLETAEQLRAEYRQKRKKPRTREVGRQGYLQTYAASGAEGLTEREVFEQLGTSRAAVRIHTLALLRSGELERCREGTTKDPYVYRVKAYTFSPLPAQRHIVLPGRPKKLRTTSQEAAD